MQKVPPNIEDPGSKNRDILYSKIHSQLLYAIPEWIRELDTNKYKDGMDKLQRRVLLRVVSGCWTVSGSAVQVIAGIQPLASVAEKQRRASHFKEKQSRPQPRKVTLKIWQPQWNNLDLVAAWTKTLIPDLVLWIQCKFSHISRGSVEKRWHVFIAVLPIRLIKQ